MPVHVCVCKLWIALIRSQAKLWRHLNDTLSVYNSNDGLEARCHLDTHIYIQHSHASICVWGLTCACECVASAKRHVVASASIVFQHFTAAAAAILRHADGCIQLAAWHIDKVEPGLTTKSQGKWSSAYLSRNLRANKITSHIWRKDFLSRGSVKSF